MRRALKWIGWSIAALIAVPAVLVIVLLVGANTPPGQTLIARLAPRLTGGLVTIEGLSGRFPDRLKAARLSLHDNKGVWATVDDLNLDWYPLRLLSGDIAIHRIAATKIAVLRSPESSGSSSGLPFAIDIDALHVGRLDIAPAVTGTAASLALDGSGAITPAELGHIVLVAKAVGASGEYHLDAHLGAADLDLRLIGQEPSHGLISKLAGLPDLGPLSIEGAFAGPRAAVATKLRLGGRPIARIGTWHDRSETSVGRPCSNRDRAGNDTAAGSVVAVDYTRCQGRWTLRSARGFGHARRQQR